MFSIESDDLKFRHPFNLIIGGASGSGKTVWVSRFLRHYKKMIKGDIRHVLYCYGVFDPKILEFEQMGIETYHGLPTEEILKNKKKPLLLILDDLMIDAKSDYLDMLFTRGSHHWNISIIFITQNMFAKEIKTARNNAHYIVLLRNPAGELQVRNLGVQLFPRRLQYFMEAYKSATNENFGYLLIDIHPSSSDLVRLRTNIFDSNIIFVPKCK